jgi:hypothetical protein
MKLDGRIPPPIYKGRLPLWDLDALDACDRQATVSRAPALPPPEAA